MKKYKLTDQNLQTHNNFQWTIGKEETADGSGELCSKGWLHYYHHPLLAVLLNPIHADTSNPKLFEIKALGLHKNDKELKGGCTKMTLIKEIPLPTITTTQKTAFAILCSLYVHSEKSYIKWATNWLKNINRTKNAAAYVAANAANTVYAANAAANAAAANAANAANADAAANAAYAAAYAADAAYAAHAAAHAAAYAAANYAAYAADAAANAANTKLPLIKIAKQAMKY